MSPLRFYAVNIAAIPVVGAAHILPGVLAVSRLTGPVDWSGLEALAKHYVFRWCSAAH